MTTSLVVSPMIQFCDADGVPLAGGFVQTLIPGTGTLKVTYADPAGLAVHSNPIVLDAAGRAVIYGSGPIRMILSDANGVLVWDQVGAAMDAMQIDWPDLAAETAARIAGDATLHSLIGANLTAQFALMNLTTLPTVDPGGGKPWNNAGVVTVGSGGLSLMELEDISGRWQLENSSGSWEFS